MAREAGLSHEDMRLLNISDVFEYVYSWIDFHDPEKKNKRKATQTDIDNFF